MGVYGNNDGPPLRARLPEVARVELGGVRFAVVHETGAAAGRERRCAAAFPEVDVLVFGHSHIPWDTIATRADGSTLRLLNPGSPTDRRRQPTYTWMTAEVGAGRLEGVTLHHLPPRTTLVRRVTGPGGRARRPAGPARHRGRPRGPRSRPRRRPPGRRLDGGHGLLGRPHRGAPSPGWRRW